MVRPVDGFLADDGTFFNTQQECEVYEATRQMQEACEHFVTETFPSLSGSPAAYLIHALMDFVVRTAHRIDRYAKINPKALTLSNDIRAPDTTVVVDDLNDHAPKPDPALQTSGSDAEGT